MAGSRSVSKSGSQRPSASTRKKKKGATGISGTSSTPSTDVHSSPASVTRREPPPQFVVPPAPQISPSTHRNQARVIAPRISNSPGSQTSGLRPNNQLQQVAAPLPPSPSAPQNQVANPDDDGEHDPSENEEEDSDGEDVDVIVQNPHPLDQIPLHELLNMPRQIQTISLNEEEGIW